MSNPLVCSEKALVKSIRFDASCFIDDFIDGIVRTPNALKPRSPRLGQHKAWTVNGLGIFERNNKAKSPYPQEALHKRPWLSPHQSMSLILKGTSPPIFGFDKGRSSALVGIITSPESALINRRFLYDTGTINRPYEAYTEQEARAYFEKNMGKSLFADDQAFEGALCDPKNANRYNEVLARIRWDSASSAVGIFSDTDESRYVAQILR